MCFTINFQSSIPVSKHLLTGLSSMDNTDSVVEVMFNSTYLTFLSLSALALYIVKMGS